MLKEMYASLQANSVIDPHTKQKMEKVILTRQLQILNEARDAEA